jgi:uncharacterized membrane protein
MADLGNSSQANTAHKHKATSWLVVLVVVVASIVLAFAMVFESLPLAIVGGVLLVLGLIGGIVWKVMDDAH